ncbi:hypothetical protein KAMFAM_220 [Bacillus phage Kamfam]|uniref:Uncharacterized protein n=2 Tax=Bastillevirus evoli TaxID=2560330 RepID=A0A024B0G0_9CAUD|nr:hypothetical protein FP76_gp154 [Bacillus phage Evoli]AMW61970.1 hypothetical protein DNAM5_226 [Bacillus phage Vinny]ASR79672.1 hypothetical protein OTK52_218 [Bacillus phage OTooleKemple52]ASR79700.1 hypothetical protein JANET_219 [Bacillus phage Janet]AXQ67334.1 hypothetical protein KAMFAM_220 [Bacillus phage Kamfam]AHZ09940.1 hypothetical protein [Bacillus phage Evoli]
MGVSNLVYEITKLISDSKEGK